MNFLETIFNRDRLSPLQKKSDIEFELHYQTNQIVNKGFEVISVFKQDDVGLILHRHFYEDTPKLEENTIILCLRVITKKGIVFPEPILKAFFNDDFSEIELADIDIKESTVSRGYGSILLGMLIEIAINRNVKNITGWISSVDKNHIERITHFYQKHGFEVVLEETDNNINKIETLAWSNNNY
jgi:ribosomal protein S18 acetylase RimI-like enzyme